MFSIEIVENAFVILNLNYWQEKVVGLGKIGTSNKQMQGRSSKEWYGDNITIIAQQGKARYENNRSNQ